MTSLFSVVPLKVDGQVFGIGKFDCETVNFRFYGCYLLVSAVVCHMPMASVCILASLVHLVLAVSLPRICSQDL